MPPRRFVYRDHELRRITHNVTTEANAEDRRGSAAAHGALPHRPHDPARGAGGDATGTLRRDTLFRISRSRDNPITALRADHLDVRAILPDLRRLLAIHPPA